MSVARRSPSVTSAVLDRLHPAEEVVLVATATVVGLGAGLGAVALRWLIDMVQKLALGPARHTALVVLVPAIGGLLVGPITHFFAAEAKGHGVPEIMEAVALKGGRIRKRVAAAKAVASAITIGTGGSAGAEGPIAQIGAGIGSSVGQMLRMSNERIANLAACGAAGGVAATFNAPIAGVLFALEVVLGEFSVGYFATVVVSSVVASVIGRIFLGDSPAFSVPAYALVRPMELLLYVLLGLLTAPTAVLFMKALYGVEDRFERLRAPAWLKPAMGGAIVGLGILLVPEAAGVGYGAIGNALVSNLAVTSLVAFLAAKLVLTSVTLGSGGSGGIFAPSLFMGAMLGGAFGVAVHTVWPAETAAPGAYALVGMSAFFAAVAHAPMTSVIMLFEMSGDYRLILPLMLATVIATILSERLSRESIYTLKLARRGVRLVRGRDVDVLQGMTVAEAMTSDLEVVRTDWPLDRLAEAFAATHHHGFPVVDEDERLVGIVTVQDLEAVAEPARAERRTGDIATRSLLVAYPDESVASALHRMGPRDVGRLPVVAREDPGRLLGVLRRQDIVRAYGEALGRRTELERLAQRARLQRLPGTVLVDVRVLAGSRADGVAVADLGLPEQCVLTAIARDGTVLIPRGRVVLRAGDRLTALTSEETLPALASLLGEMPQRSASPAR